MAGAVREHYKAAQLSVYKLAVGRVYKERGYIYKRAARLQGSEATI